MPAFSRAYVNIADRLGFRHPSSDIVEAQVEPDLQSFEHNNTVDDGSPVSEGETALHSEFQAEISPSSINVDATTSTQHVSPTSTVTTPARASSYDKSGAEARVLEENR